MVSIYVALEVAYNQNPNFKRNGFFNNYAM